MIFTKGLCYLLGYLWADSCVESKINPTKKDPQNIQYRISLEILEVDGRCIEDLFKNTGLNWRIRTRARKNSKNIQMSFTLNNFKTCNQSMDLLNFLINSGYQNKSGSHYQVINKIPEEYRKYWFRGFFDGDGCMNVSCITKGNHNSKAFRFYFYGPIEQKWDYVLDIFKSLDIQATYQTISRKSGKHLSSHIMISSRDEILKIFNYMYPDNIYDFGLKRKFDKLYECFEYIPKQKYFRKKENTETHKVYN
jgi:hypothetical protein